MQFFILASGSKGNSTIIKSKDSFIVIDVGLGIREFKEKIKKHNFDFDKINAVLITHNHSDHTKSLKYFPKEIIYANKDVECNYIFKPFESVVIEGFKITPVPLSHDADDCYGFLIEKNNQKLVYITDTGYINQKLKPYIKNADYYILESNHDIKMLLNSDRPGYLKNRILSDEGHLSNDLASEMLCELIGKKTKEIVFAHVSREVNTKEKVIETFQNNADFFGISINHLKLKIADQEEETIGGNIK